MTAVTALAISAIKNTKDQYIERQQTIAANRSMHYMTSMELVKVAETKRGYALLLTAGDEAISKALASGILEVRLPMAKPLEPEQREVVSAEIDRQKIADELRRELHPVPVDYAGLAYTAEVLYGESLYEPGVWEKVGKAMLVVYALAVLGFERLFRTVGT